MSKKASVPVVLACAALFLAGPAAPAAGQDFGVRAGASVDPDQFYFGGHLETDPLVDRVHLRPALEIGVGDDLTATTINIEAVYKYPLPGGPWSAYGGGGPVVAFYNFDGGSETEAGFNLVGGLEHETGFFFEVKGGLGDAPDFKVGVGYTWRRR